MCSSALMDSTKTDNNPVERNVNMCLRTTILKWHYKSRWTKTNGSDVQTTTGEFPPKSIQTENCSATAYEGLLPVTDTANHAGLWLEKNGKEIAIKGIHVRNGLKPCYLLPRQQMETHLLLCLTIDKNNGRPRTMYVGETSRQSRRTLQFFKK